MSAPRVLVGKASSFGNPFGLAQVMIDGVLIDVTTAEEHTFDAETTEFPIESGSTISDNVRLKPTVVTLDGIVSNTPIGMIAAARAAAGGSNNPAADVYALFKTIRERREPITITTSLDQFDNMIMTHLSVPRKAAQGDALFFNATFQQVTIVENKRVRVRTSTRGGGGKAGLGTVPVIPIPASVITWRHGVPPGGPLIRTVTHVLYTQHYFYHLQETRISAATASAIDAANNAGNSLVAIANGQKPPAPEITGLKKLTAVELQEFARDMARDTKGQKFENPDYRHSLTPGRFEGGDARTIAKGVPFIPLSDISQNPNEPPKSGRPVKLRDGSGFDPLVNAFKRPFGT